MTSGTVDLFNQIVEVEVDNEDQALLLLCSLLEWYENLVDTMLCSRMKLALEDVKSSLLSKKFMRKVVETQSGDSDAIVGAVERDSNEWELILTATEVTKAYEDVSCDMLATILDSLETRWILDSGCSYHMYPNRELFTSYEKIGGGKVLMGNNACRVIDIGTVRVKMFDGMTRTLSNVGLGYEYKGKYGVLKVSRGALVVMKGAKHNGLYILWGSTITGTSTVSSADQDAITIKLLHVRLGHISERGLTKLSKRGLLCSHKIRKLDLCEYCILRKQHKVPSKSGCMYVLIFIDDYSRKVSGRSFRQKLGIQLPT
ncbi:hypothetical protein CRG98_013348 [Punica granatum]|uniref:Uncharacterized protein n=1 Tax=Punica granatum TaxID=22663 RepID=A0A2I0KCK8_PUNGR|nr:hypothetical protein CRG98_013348 [Punica granatum]